MMKKGQPGCPCCGGTGCLVCGPCWIPDRNLTYSYTGVAPLSPTTGSGTLLFNHLVGYEHWQGGSFAGGYFLDAGCSGFFLPNITGLITYSFSSSSIYVSSCSPLSITYQVPNPSAAYTAGFRTITISDPGAPANPCPCPYNTVHVDGCGGPGLPGAAVEIKDSTGVTVSSGTTDSNGNFASAATGGPYSITVSKSRFVTKTVTNQFICNTPGSLVPISMDPAAGYVCLIGRSCPDPVKVTLTASHSFFGSTTATSSGAGWGFVWPYAYGGIGGCNPDTVDVSLGMSNGMVPLGPVDWPACADAQPPCFGTIFPFARGCPSSGGTDTCFDGVFGSPAIFAQTSFSCPPAFSWSGSVTFNIINGSCDYLMYGLIGTQTFTLTIVE